MGAVYRPHAVSQVERARARRGGEAGDVIGSRLCKAGGYTMGHTTPSRARNQSICTHPSHTGSRVRYHNLPPTPSRPPTRHKLTQWSLQNNSQKFT